MPLYGMLSLFNLEPVLPVAICFHASRSPVTSALASPRACTLLSGNPDILRLNLNCRNYDTLFHKHSQKFIAYVDSHDSHQCRGLTQSFFRCNRRTTDYSRFIDEVFYDGWPVTITVVTATSNANWR